MHKIPTAEEFMLNEYETDDVNKIVAEPQHVKWMMIEFAKLHVQPALKAAAENCRLKVPEDRDAHALFVIDRESILNAYPLTNVK